MIVSRALYLLAGISTASNIQYPGFDLVNKKQTELNNVNLDNPAIICSNIERKLTCYSLLKLGKVSDDKLNLDKTYVKYNDTVTPASGVFTDLTTDKIVIFTQKAIIDAFKNDPKKFDQLNVNLDYNSNQTTLKSIEVLEIKTSDKSTLEKLNQYTVTETKDGKETKSIASNYMNALSAGLIGNTIVGSKPATLYKYMTDTKIDDNTKKELKKLYTGLNAQSTVAACQSSLVNKNSSDSGDKIIMFSYDMATKYCVGYTKAGLEVAFKLDTDSSTSKKDSNHDKTKSNDSGSDDSAKARELFVADVQTYIKTNPNANKLGKNAYYGIVSSYNDFVRTTDSDNKNTTKDSDLLDRLTILTAPIELNKPIAVASFDSSVSKLSTVKIVLIVICVVLVIVAIATAIWFVWSNKKST